MVGFITRNPSVAPALTEEETPERLLLKAVAIDPLYVPGLDALMDKLTSEGRHAEAYGLLRQRVYPWIRFLARQDSAAADRYLQFLLAVARARGEAGFARELESILPEVQATRELVKDRWWFSAVSAGDGRLADPSFGTRCSPVSPGIAWTGPAGRSFS